jgi:hypothetical protein
MVVPLDVIGGGLLLRLLSRYEETKKTRLANSLAACIRFLRFLRFLRTREPSVLLFLL